MKAIKRFVVFAGMNEHPRGGWSDFQASYDTGEEAHGFIHSIGFMKWQWCQIVDLETGRVLVPADAEYMR
jgi:hypothetical protein